MSELTLDFPQADVDALMAAVNRAMTELNKDAKKAISWGGAYLCDSLRASTKVAPKRRKVFKTTADKVFTDSKKISKSDRLLVREMAEYAPYGVYLWRRGKQEFWPINKSMKPRTIAFKSCTTGRMLGRIAGTNEVHRIESFAANKKDMKTHPLVIIEHSGLAKKAWQIAKAKVVSGGYGFAMRVKRAVVSVTWSGGKNDSQVTIADRLGYALDAFKSDGKQTVDTAFKRAADRINNRITDALAKRAEGSVR